MHGSYCSILDVWTKFGEVGEDVPEYFSSGKGVLKMKR